MATDRMDALVIFGATGDLAKLETFPALVGLVERGVLDVPVIGVAKSGWDLDGFREYAAASLRLNELDPQSPAAVKLLGLLRYVDGDLGDPVDSVEITMAEAFDVADRGSFYDRTGAVRDVVQNHMLQVLASTLADLPARRDDDEWRQSKGRLIGQIRPLTPQDTVFGQYE